jgi:hypothetical protein
MNAKERCDKGFFSFLRPAVPFESHGAGAAASGWYLKLKLAHNSRSRCTIQHNLENPRENQ